MGIRDRPISARSPWQNGLAERLSALTTSLSLASGIFVICSGRTNNIATNPEGTCR
jgi:hypothetical protein